MTKPQTTKRILILTHEQIKTILSQGYKNNLVATAYVRDPIWTEKFLEALRNHRGDQPLELEVS